MKFNITLLANLDALANEAPTAVESYSPGHWALMEQLECRAPEVIQGQDVEAFVRFLSDTAFLKMPHGVNRESVRRDLNNHTPRS